MTVVLYAIQLFHCIDFVPFSILQCSKESNVDEIKKKNVQCDVDDYQYEKWIEELCPCVCKSVQEDFLIFCCCFSAGRWSFWDPLFTRCSASWLRFQVQSDSSNAHSWNVSSIIVPRCLSSKSLVLSENCSLELCSKCGISQWVWDEQWAFLLLLDFLFLFSFAADILESWWLIIVVQMLGQLGVKFRVCVSINLLKIMIHNVSFWKGYFVKVYTWLNTS